MPGTAAPGQAPPAQLADYPTYWGVDSVTHIDDTVLPGDCRTFFKLVADRAGTRPQFWARYIGSPTQSYNLGASEIPYAASQGVKILLIYTGITSEPQSDIGEANGIAKARDAISNAQARSVPGGTHIYLNAEPGATGNPYPDYGFYKGWFNTFASATDNPSGYKAGVYLGRPPDTSTGFVGAFPAFCDAYAGGAPGPAVPSMRGALVWTVRWNPCNTNQDFGLFRNRPIFAPPRPPCGPPTVLHQNEGNCHVPGARLGQDIDMDVANTTAFRSLFAPPAPQFQERAGTPSVSDVLDWKWIWLGSAANGPEGSYFTTRCPQLWRGYNNWALGRTSDQTAQPLDCPASPSTNHPPTVSASWTNFGFAIPANAIIVGIEVYASGNYSPRPFGPYIISARNVGPSDSCQDWIWQETTDTLYIPGRDATVSIISGSKSGSKPLGQVPSGQPGPISCVYGTAGGSWDGVTWTPADINTGFSAIINVPNFSWAGPGVGASVFTRNNCNCFGFWNCPDNRPADIPTIRLGLTVTKVRVYYRL
jgi:hypothetical protein